MPGNLDRAEGGAMVLVTRPEEAGRLLAERLRGAQCPSLWWPAFDLLPPEDPDELQARIARLESFDLVIFVSPAAVRAFAGAIGAMSATAPPLQWPQAARVAAVGSATREAALRWLPGAHEPSIVAPEGSTAAEGGSEALIEALGALEPAPRRVLLVRAQAGRESLVRWLLARGATVEEAVAYRRVAHEPDAAQWSALRMTLGAGARLAVLYTSSESVGVVARHFAGRPDLRDTFAASIALCIHERIERTLREAGWRDVRRCGLDAGSICHALQGPAGPGATPRAADAR